VSFFRRLQNFQPRNTPIRVYLAVSRLGFRHLVPSKSEIEQGAFLPPGIVDGWTSARPEDLAPAFWSAGGRTAGRRLP